MAVELLSTTIFSALIEPCIKEKSLLKRRQAVVVMEIAIDFINFWTDIGSIIELANHYSGTINEFIFLVTLLGFFIYAMCVQLSYVHSKFKNDENYMLYIGLTCVGIHQSAPVLYKWDQLDEQSVYRELCVCALFWKKPKYTKHTTKNKQTNKKDRITHDQAKIT